MKEKTRAIFAFIERTLDNNMPSPSYSEIAEEVGCSIGTIRCHLEALREAGMIEWEELKARTIRLVGGSE